MAPRLRDDGTAQSMEEIMASIHAWTEEWKAEQTGKPLMELVRSGLATRADMHFAWATDDPVGARPAPIAR